MFSDFVLDTWYKVKSKFRDPNPIMDCINPYDLPGELLQALQQKKTIPDQIFRFNLTTAQEGFEVKAPGMHLECIGGVGPNGPISINPFVYADLHLEDYTPGIPGFPLRNTRGFSGPFRRFFLSWPAQGAGATYMYVTVYKGPQKPWKPY